MPSNPYRSYECAAGWRSLHPGPGIAHQRALTRSRTSATTRSSWASPSRDRSPRSALQSWSQTQAPEDSYRSAAPLYSRKPAARLSSAEACRGDSAIGRSGRVHGLRDEVRPRPPAEDGREVLTEAMARVHRHPQLQQARMSGPAGPQDPGCSRAPLQVCAKPRGGLRHCGVQAYRCRRSRTPMCRTGRGTPR